jgi:hypothetical protein
MGDEIDRELDAASQRQDATDAKQFRADAGELHAEAVRDRNEAAKLREMGLKPEADRYATDATAMDKRSADFTHRAELLEDAIHHRQDADRAFDTADKADAAAKSAHAAAARTSEELNKGTGQDADRLVELTGDLAAANAREKAMRDLADSTRGGGKAEIEFAAEEEEREARAGLPGRHVHPVEGMPPLVDPWAPSSGAMADQSAADPVAMATPAGDGGDPWATGPITSPDQLES